MTTYTLTGFSTRYNAFGDLVEVKLVELSAIFPTDPPVLRYEVISGAGTLDQVSIFTADTRPLSFAIDGVQGSFSWDLTIGYIDTALGRTFILSLYDTVADQDFNFILGGALFALPSSIPALNALIASVTGIGVITSGPFAPGTDINVLAIPNIGVTENDQYFGTSANETFDAGIGDDTIDASGGDDTLNGGAGADSLDGGAGFDTASYADATGRVRIDLLNPDAALGDAVGDLFVGIEAFELGAFNDVFNGDNGINWAFGLAGDDYMRGRGGRDRLFGDEGNDTLNGGKGRDRLEGGDDNDLLMGLGGLDNLRGGKGDDTLEGGDNRDVLLGGRGRDVIDGGNDDDVMTGNGDADTFIFADGHGNDTITDFEATNDNEKIDLSAVSAIGAITDITDPGGAGTQVGADVLIDTGGGNSILLKNVLLTDLDGADFLF